MAMKNATDKKSRTENSRKISAKKATIKSPDELLTGWPAIAQYLGQPTAVAQRWAKSGMPVQRKGQSMTARPNELSAWIGKEAKTGMPVHIAQSSDDDLLADLRRGLKEARSSKRTR
jgi:hypothetical protein